MTALEAKTWLNIHHIINILGAKMTSTDSASTHQSHLHLPLGGSHINELIDVSSSASAEDSDASGSQGLFLIVCMIKRIYPMPGP